MLIKDLGIRVVGNVPKIIKGSTHENQPLGVTGLSCSRGGLLKFEMKVSIDPRVQGEVHAHGKDGVLIPNAQ